MTHVERLAKIQTLILQASADEVRLLLCLAERIVATRPAGIDTSIPRDQDGDVSAALQGAVDLAIGAATGLSRARMHRP
jgi:hypothetical protein